MKKMTAQRRIAREQHRQQMERELKEPARIAKNPDFADVLTMAAPNAIERQEKRGQDAFVNTATLPKSMRGVTREQLEALGFIFSDDFDDLFVNVTLPDGWRKEATDHFMWSKLVDAEDKERASIFYKAAFYDRDAFLNWIKT